MFDWDLNLAGIYLFKVNNGNIVNFEQISHSGLVFPLFTLNK